MPQGPLTLTDALLALGKAVPFVGDWTTVDGMEPLGATEGPITETGGWSINAFTANEHTGGVAHRATAVPGTLAINVPLFVGDPDLYAKITPHGSADGVGDNPANVQETGLWLVPLACFPEGGTIGYDGTSWSPLNIEDDPLFQNSILFGRGFWTHGDISHPFENGGKSITTATYTPMYDSRLPAGKRVWVRGDPVAKGVTTFRF